ncbi:MAG: FAD:protein FMN transferase [Verrucomicrobiota bacterium]
MIESRSFAALGTTAVVAVDAESDLDRAEAMLREDLAELDAACSRFRTDSELSALNSSAGADVRVGELLFRAVGVAIDVARLTDGLVDPTVGRTLRLAGYDRTFAQVEQRDGSRLRPMFAAVPGWRAVVLDEGRRTIRVPRGVELDLGATAKAMAADRAAGRIAEATGGGVLVSLGGDVSVAGPAPGAGWPLRIADDHAAPLGGPGPTVSIVGGGLASSGTRVRRWTTAGGELHHIVDPRTARPAVTPWRTVTVAAATCVGANAASTAAVVLGDDAPGWLEERTLPARLVGVSGGVVAVGGWPGETP